MATRRSLQYLAQRDRQGASLTPTGRQVNRFVNSIGLPSSRTYSNQPRTSRNQPREGADPGGPGTSGGLISVDQARANLYDSYLGSGGPVSSGARPYRPNQPHDSVRPATPPSDVVRPPGYGGGVNMPRPGPVTKPPGSGLYPVKPPNKPMSKPMDKATVSDQLEAKYSGASLGGKRDYLGNINPVFKRYGGLRNSRGGPAPAVSVEAAYAQNRGKERAERRTPYLNRLIGG